MAGPQGYIGGIFRKRRVQLIATHEPLDSLAADIETLLADTRIHQTERLSLIRARMGQGIFRDRLAAYWRGCSITGFRQPELLVASHIKPWSISSHEERLDPFNGLLLLPNLDKAFDRGFITFEQSGTLMISKELASPEALGLNPDMRIRLSARHNTYLNVHGEKVFRSGEH